MSFNFVRMKSLCSWALKAQIPRQQVKPVQLARLNSNAVGGDVKKFDQFEKDEDAVDEVTFSEKDRTSVQVDRSINEVKLLGKIVREPHVNLDSPRPFATFRVTTKRRLRNADTGETRNFTETHTLTTFNPDMIQTIQKKFRQGQKVFATGRLIYRPDKTGGWSAQVLISNCAGIDSFD